MLQIAITISGDKQTIEKLQKTGQGLANMGLAMNSIGKRLSSFYGNEVFASEGSAIDERWKPLSPKYKMYKATGHTTMNSKRKSSMRTYPGAGILVKTGSMKNSFKYDATKNSTTIRNTAPYFKYHQSTEARSKLPRRPMMGVNDNVRNIVYDIVDTYVKDQILKAGL